jgi:hypothetical protein
LCASIFDCLWIVGGSGGGHKYDCLLRRCERARNRCATLGKLRNLGNLQGRCLTQQHTIVTNINMCCVGAAWAQNGQLVHKSRRTGNTSPFLLCARVWLLEIPLSLSLFSLSHQSISLSLSLSLFLSVSPSVSLPLPYPASSTEGLQSPR